MSLFRILSLWLAALRAARKPVPWWSMLKTLLRGKRARPELWRARMRTCMRCPVYDQSLHRCANRIGFVELGCECSMPIKALFEKATCWAREQGFPYGWNK